MDESIRGRVQSHPPSDTRGLVSGFSRGAGLAEAEGVFRVRPLASGAVGVRLDGETELSLSMLGPTPCVDLSARGLA